MDHQQMIAAVAADGARLCAVAQQRLDESVPTCPGWSMGDLVAHLGHVHLSVAHQVESRATERVSPERIESAPDGDRVIGWAQAARERLVEALGSVDGNEPMWTWSHDHTAGFFVRRMVHETAVHRYDGEAAAGEVTAIDADQAVDGIDELYGKVLPFSLANWPRPVPTGSLHLHRTDGAGEWMLTSDGSKIAVEHAHGKGEAALRGSAHDLFLAMWGRVDIAELELFGDEGVARAWIALAP